MRAIPDPVVGDPAQDEQDVGRALRNARRLIAATAASLLFVALLAIGLNGHDWPSSVGDALSSVLEEASPGVVVSVAAILVGTGLVGLVLWGPRSQAAKADWRSRRSGLWVGAAFLVFALAMMLGTALEARGIRRAAEARLVDQQVSVAKLKAEKVDAWSNERLLALRLLASSLSSLPLDRLEADKELHQVADIFLAQFVASDPERIAAGIFTSDGNLLLSAGDFSPPMRSALRQEIRQALSRKQPAIGLPLPGGLRPTGLSLPIIVPLERAAGPAGPAVLVSVVDPTAMLLRGFGSWPTPSKTSQVELLFANGGELVHIVTGKEREHLAPLSFRVPIANDQLVGAKGAKLGSGTWNALDHHGRRVLGATFGTRDMPWIVVAKTQMTEVMAEVEPQVLQLWILTVAIILFGGLLSLSLGAQLALARVLDSDRRRLSRSFGANRGNG